jgi:hypothetical protein
LLMCVCRWTGALAVASFRLVLRIHDGTRRSRATSPPS